VLNLDQGQTDTHTHMLNRLLAVKQDALC
jgi:hypothetical protein